MQRYNFCTLYIHIYSSLSTGTNTHIYIARCTHLLKYVHYKWVLESDLTKTSSNQTCLYSLCNSIPHQEKANIMNELRIMELLTHHSDTTRTAAITINKLCHYKGIWHNSLDPATPSLSLSLPILCLIFKTCLWCMSQNAYTQICH